MTNDTDNKRPTSRRPVPALPPPAWLGDWRLWLLAVILLLAPFLVPIPRALRHHTVIASLGDQLHTVLFCGMTFLLYWRGPLTGRLVPAAATAAFMGGSIEFIQILVGRTPLVHDFLIDLVGIGIASGYILWRGHGRRAGLALCIALLITIPIQLRNLPFIVVGQYEVQDKFPVIADFEGRWEHTLWEATHGAEARIVRENADATAGRSVNHVLRLSTAPSSYWPGAAMRRFPPDWTDYTYLSLRVRQQPASLDTLVFNVRLEDFAGHRDSDWAIVRFRATSDWQTFDLPLADLRMEYSHRRLDLRDMEQILIFLSRPERDTVLEIDDIRLR